MSEPATPRLAATVMPLRSGHRGLEVFTIRRSSSMSFAPGAVVFPGGTIDPSDDDAGSWVGPGPEHWAELFFLDADTARRAVTAAIRELFEESGLLLAGDHVSLVDSSELTWQMARNDLEAHRITLADLLNAHGLALRTDLLAARDRWVTPEKFPRRYDTLFFAAHVPAGCRALVKTPEAAASAWVSPADLLADADAGRCVIMPPTRTQLVDLADVTASDVVVSRPSPARMMAPYHHESGRELWREVRA